jgi:lysophospholipase L1-like esterase
MRKFLKRFGLVVLTTLVIVIVIEIILRTFFPVYPTGDLRAYQYDDQLGARLKPNLHEFYLTDHQEEIVTNSLGTLNLQEDFTGYKRLVFAIGDSFTQGVGVPADMSYPAQLDLMLNKDPSGMYLRTYGVVNLGLSGFGGEQELLALKRWSQQIGPPAVILYLGCDNDYEDDLLFASGYRHKHIVDGNPTWGPLVRPVQWLTNDLQIGLRTKLLISDLRRSEISPGPSERTVAEMERPVLERLVQYAHDNNARLIVSWAGENYSYYWLKRWSEQNDVRFADWAPRVRSVLAAIPNMSIDNPHSSQHHRGWVNGIIAQSYAEQINANNSSPQ